MTENNRIFKYKILHLSIRPELPPVKGLKKCICNFVRKYEEVPYIYMKENTINLKYWLESYKNL